MTTASAASPTKSSVKQEEHVGKRHHDAPCWCVSQALSCFSAILPWRRCRMALRSAASGCSSVSSAGWPRPGDRPRAGARGAESSAVVEDGGQTGEADRAAEVARQVVQARGVLHPLGRQACRARCC